MSSNANERYCRGKWTYSLKGLLFLTSVVAICSALIGLSAVLAVVCLPLILAALVSTVRASMQSSGRQHQDGLFVTFCRSLLIVVCLIGASAMAILVAACAIALIVLGIAARVAQPIVVVANAGTRQLLQLVTRLWEQVRSPGFRRRVADAFLTTQVSALRATRSLISACRVLFQRWWNPQAGWN